MPIARRSRKCRTTVGRRCDPNEIRTGASRRARQVPGQNCQARQYLAAPLFFGLLSSPGFCPPTLNAKAHHTVFLGVHAFPAAERPGAMRSRKISEEAGGELSHSSTMLSADIIEGMRICYRRPPFRTMGFEHDAGTRNAAKNHPRMDVASEGQATDRRRAGRARRARGTLRAA